MVEFPYRRSQLEGQLLTLCLGVTVIARDVKKIKTHIFISSADFSNHGVPNRSNTLCSYFKDMGKGVNH